jgi:hypothetical protein
VNFRVPEIFLGALLAVAIFALGFSVATSFRYPIQNSTAQSAEQPRQGAGDADNRLANYTLALDWLNGFLVLSTFLLWLASRRSARIAERALTELEAPFVFVQINAPGLEVRGGAVTWGNLQWSVVNFGRTPASILEIFVDQVRLIPFGEDPEPVNPSVRRGDRLPFGVIAPPNGQSHNFPVVPVNAALQQTGPPGQPFSTHSPFFLGFVR